MIAVANALDSNQVEPPRERTISERNGTLGVTTRQRCRFVVGGVDTGLSSGEVTIRELSQLPVKQRDGIYRVE